MENVPIKEYVMIQQGIVFAMKDLKVLHAKVFSLAWISTLNELTISFYIDVSCPGGEAPCSNNGQCDLTIGLCNCNEEYQGDDCAGNSIFTH